MAELAGVDPSLVSIASSLLTLTLTLTTLAQPQHALSVAYDLCTRQLQPCVSQVSIALSAASVIITATIAVPASHSASEVNAALSASLRTADAASAALGITIVSAPTVVTTPPSSPSIDPPAPPAPGVDASPAPTPCADDDAKLMLESDDRILSCASGFATYNNDLSRRLQVGTGAQQGCSEDMFVESAGAPVGWFIETCPVTCGTCQYDPSPPAPMGGGGIGGGGMGGGGMGGGGSPPSPSSYYPSSSPIPNYDSSYDPDQDDSSETYDSPNTDEPCYDVCEEAACFSAEDISKPECAACCQCHNGGTPCGGSAGSCGDGVCDPYAMETYLYVGYEGGCYVDCHCSDGWCDPDPPANETSANCPADCPSMSCGNGVCEPEANETAATCYEDCHCGDGFCDRRLGLGVGLGMRLGLGLRLGLELGLGLGLGPGWLS